MREKTSSHRDPPLPLGAGENGHSGASRVGRGQGGWQHPAYLRHARRCVLHAHWRSGMLGYMGLEAWGKIMSIVNAIMLIQCIRRSVVADQDWVWLQPEL